MEPMSKDQARTLFRGQRRALDPAERQRQADRMEAHLLPWLEENAPHRTLTCVLSYGAEPPTGRLMGSLHASGYRVLAPICEPARRLAWTEWFPGVAMERCAVAPIDEPVGERLGVEAMGQVDLVLVPAQAIDANGARLGQGGGYYDRFIASLDGLGRRPTLLATVYEHELVPADSFVYDAFDRLVDGVLTASGFTWFGGPPAA